MPNHFFVAAFVLISTFVAGGITGARVAEASRSALERTIAEYDMSTSTKDASQIVRHFRPDVVVLSPQSREPAIGIDENRAAWTRFFALPKAEHSIRTTDIVMSEAGDLAYTRGKWTARFERPDGTAVPGNGELITIWRRDPTAGTTGSGEWRAAVVMAHRVQ